MKTPEEFCDETIDLNILYAMADRYDVRELAWKQSEMAYQAWQRLPETVEFYEGVKVNDLIKDLEKKKAIFHKWFADKLFHNLNPQ